MDAVQKNTRTFYWTGSITTKTNQTYEFGNDDIVKGSGYINRQCCGNTEIELGTVYAAEMGISLYLDIDRYTLEEAEIRLSFHLVYEDETEEEVPMGVFYVAEANRCIKTLELKAYDGMLNLDKNFSKGLSSAYPYEFLSLLSKACHIELAQTKEEIEAMPNGTELLGIYQDNDIESWRDFLYYLAQTLGCFAIIDRFGRLNLSAYGNTAVMAVDIRHRFSSSFSDFVTRYTAVSSTNKRTEKAEYYAKSPDDGLTMNLGVNPLLQFGLEETRKRIINAILDVITSVEYVPFDSDTIGNPALDLGDVLRFTGGHADETKQSAITSIYTKINGKQTVKCVGKNPRLAAAKSKNDKNITGLINSIGETKLSIYTFANALALDVGAEKLSIINMEFASGDETNAEFHAQAILQVESNPDTRTLTAETTIDLGTTTDDNGTTVENKKVISFPLSWDEDGKTELSVFYVLDGHEVEEFHPKESWLSGKHLLTLYYPIMELTANQLHTFEVLISMKNGAGHIEAQNIMATITGQGLGVQERWDGKITAEETMKKLLLSSMQTHTLQDVVMVHFLSPKKTGLNDHVASISLIGMPMRSMKDTLRLFAPIVRDVVETDDKKKMNYKKEYVLAEDVFRLRKDYALSGNSSIRLDRGRMLKLVISTENFDSLTALTIQPFETFPFINMEVLYPGNLSFSELTEQVGDAVKLKTSFSRQVSGQNQEINRGRLAAFSMGIGDMADIEELEVSNV
ncbi:MULTISPECIES: hypothetical protein [Clostridium]|uniref:hypothetical protein n=1 Tax=Clostridium TaxID=1485 RepID=UPI001A9A527F|nr:MULTISPECIES: hypothetical protein [Clostridium]